MSLEDEISKLTSAITGLTTITEKLTSLRADAIETVKKEAAPAPKAEKPKADKPKEEPKTETPPADDVHTKMREAVADYIGEIDRANERAARKEKMKALLNHEKIKKPGIETATSTDHIADASIPLFLDQVAKLKAKGALTEPEKAAAEDDLGL